MGTLKVVLFHFFFIFPVIYASYSSQSHDCKFSLCNDNTILIRFPFQLQGDQDPYCGYPGFKLTCTLYNTILELPHSGEFYVRNINYLTQQIQIYDPIGCIPRRLLSLNFSGSPFNPAFSRNYTFFSCPISQNSREGSQFIPIDCLTNSTHYVSAVPSLNLNNSLLPRSCKVIKWVLVPLARSYKENHVDDLNEDLLLKWDKPDCRFCESQELKCRFSRNNSNQLVCFSNQTGNPHGGVGAFRIITLCIVVPASLGTIGVAFCVCYKDRLGYPPINNTAQQTAITQPESAAISTTTGLDESTIESYEKLVIGDSKRLPGPNDGTCWICLSEYNSKETIRCIPECKHCFHAECIDEWLHLNATCPVCRNSPSPSPDNDDMNMIMSSNTT